MWCCAPIPRSANIIRRSEGIRKLRFPDPARTAYTAVIPRESGVPSTLQLLDSVASALEYWIVRFRGRRQHLPVSMLQPWPAGDDNRRLRCAHGSQEAVDLEFQPFGLR